MCFLEKSITIANKLRLEHQVDVSKAHTKTRYKAFTRENKMMAFNREFIKDNNIYSTRKRKGVKKDERGKQIKLIQIG